MAVILDADGKTVKYQYDLLGCRVAMQYPNGVLARFAYNKMGKLSNLIYVDSGNEEIARYDYQYNVLGNRILADEGTKYQYDTLSRLVKVISPDQKAIEYTYDTLGNRTSEIAGGKVTPYTFNSFGQLLKVGANSTHHTYDNAGNTVSITSPEEKISLSYNERNEVTETEKLTKEGKTKALYSYDPFGRRTQKTIYEGEKKNQVQYLYNAFNILAEYRDGEDVPVQYVSGPKIDEILYRIEPDGERYYYIRDGLNSVRMVVDEEGKIVEKFDYDPFGEIQGEVKENRTIFAFTGREFDQETGLYYYRARYYQPEIGRFLSPDPLGMVDGPNLYVYVSNNPVNWIDPLGLTHYDSSDVSDIKNEATNGLLQGSDLGSYFGTAFEFFGGGGTYDYVVNEPDATFEVHGETITSGQFGNYLAGFATYYVFQDAGAFGTLLGGNAYALGDAILSLMSFEWPDSWLDNPESLEWIIEGIADAMTCLGES